MKASPRNIRAKFFQGIRELGIFAILIQSIAKYLLSINFTYTICKYSKLPSVKSLEFGQQKQWGSTIFTVTLWQLICVIFSGCLPWRPSSINFRYPPGCSNSPTILSGSLKSLSITCTRRPSYKKEPQNNIIRSFYKQANASYKQSLRRFCRASILDKV